MTNFRDLLSKDYAERFTSYERWCAAHNLATLPLSDDTLSLYLLAHWDNWGAGTVKNVFHALKAAHHLSGHPAVALPDSEAVRKAWRLEKGVVTEEHKVDALDPMLLGRIVGHFFKEAEPSTSTRFTQTMVRVAHRHRLRVPDITTALVEALAMEGRHARVSVSVDEQKLIVDGLADRSVAAPVRHRIDWTAKRLSLPTEPFVGAGLTSVELDWHIAAINPDMTRTLRTTSYLTVGHAVAARHADLARIQLEDVSETLEGYELGQRGEKSRSTSQVRHLVSHTCDGDRSRLCPACSLGAWLECLRVVHRRTSGPLLAVYYGRSWKTMHTNTANLFLKNACDAVGADAEGRRIATRSLRAGKSTEMARANVSLAGIMAITRHKTENEFLRYVRAIGPWDAWRLQT